MAGHRLERVSQLIKEEISKILLEELDAPLDILVTVTHVAVSKDLAHARVSVSIFPFDKSQDIMSWLQKNIYDLQQLLNKKLRMHPIPKISFELDASEEEAARKEKLLKEIKENKRI